MTRPVKTSLIIVGVLSVFVAGGIFITHFAKAQTAITVNGATYNSVREALEFTLPKNKATVKGEQIAKIQVIPKTQRGEYFIEVANMKARENGVEVFVRAWDKNGNQIGFGRDGSVEIERFVIINPPILVPDENGDIERVYGENKDIMFRYREDLQEALLQSLVHTMQVKKQKYGPWNIIQGKVGNTTLTAYPAAGESTPVDGNTTRGGGSESWDSIHDSTGTGVSSMDTANILKLSSTATTNQWSFLFRFTYGFNTSSIGSDGVDSATMSMYGQNDNNSDSFSQSVEVDHRDAPANTAMLATTDYDLAVWDSVAQATSIASGSWGVESYNNFTLNATGMGNVNKSGYSWFGARYSGDLTDTSPTWTSSGQTRLGMYFADETGTTKDPKLVVEHSSEPPVLSNLQSSSITSNSAVIEWTTNVSSDSEVTYDTTSPVTDGDPSSYDATASTNHSVALTGLSAGTTYYYFASSTGASAVSGTSTESSFATLSFDIFNPHATNVGAGWADIKWTTSTGSNSKVWYSLTSPVSATNFTEVASSTANTTAHSLFVSGLLHNAVYYFIVTSTNGTGGTSTSTEKQFNTTSVALCTE